MNIIDLYLYKNYLEEMIQAQGEELATRESRIRARDFSTIDFILTVIESRNTGADKHIQCTRKFAEVLLYGLRYKYGITEEQIGLILSAAALHDIGKIAIPDAVLLKPGSLTRDEFELVKTHTTRGAEIIEKIDMYDAEYKRYCRDICLYHHERYDGKGYPAGLKGDEIPVWVQAVAIANVYDALISKQVYRRLPYSPGEAIRIILDGGCGQFDPEVLAVMERAAPKLKELAKTVRGTPALRMDGPREIEIENYAEVTAVN
jgi:putative two-component system response regulator